MKLIKQQNQAQCRVDRLSFTEEAAPVAAAETLPAWITLAGAARKAERPKTAIDTGHAEKDAFENGFRQGEKAGAELAEKKLETLMRRYADAILEIGKLKPALYEQAERDVVRLSLEIAKKIVHREVQIDREIVQTLIRVALSHVAIKSPVTIRLHPEDHNFVLEQQAALQRPGAGDQEFTLLADNSVELGGCLIETECGDIDARIGEQFLEVERTFFSSRE